MKKTGLSDVNTSAGESQWGQGRERERERQTDKCQPEMTPRTCEPRGGLFPSLEKGTGWSETAPRSFPTLLLQDIFFWDFLSSLEGLFFWWRSSRGVDVNRVARGGWRFGMEIISFPLSLDGERWCGEGGWRWEMRGESDESRWFCQFLGWINWSFYIILEELYLKLLYIYF